MTNSIFALRSAIVEIVNIFPKAHVPNVMLLGDINFEEVEGPRVIEGTNLKRAVGLWSSLFSSIKCTDLCQVFFAICFLFIDPKQGSQSIEG